MNLIRILLMSVILINISVLTYNFYKLKKIRKIRRIFGEILIKKKNELS